MLKEANMIAAAALLTVVIVSPSLAQAVQTQSAPADPMIGSIQLAAKHVQSMFTKAAEQMSEEDYAFKPTPEVRSFGQLLAHVAQTNYWFCSAALGEKIPVTGIEKDRTTRADIQKTLDESFAYCDRAYASMSDDTKAKAMKDFRGHQFPALAVLNFRTYHSLLHWGNAITYIRLRGKVPPSTESR